jgi:hypothetical protein
LNFVVQRYETSGASDSGNSRLLELEKTVKGWLCEFHIPRVRKISFLICILAGKKARAYKIQIFKANLRLFRRFYIENQPKPTHAFFQDFTLKNRPKPIYTFFVDFTLKNRQKFENFRNSAKLSFKV